MAAQNGLSTSMGETCGEGAEDSGDFALRGWRATRDKKPPAAGRLTLLPAASGALDSVVRATNRREFGKQPAMAKKSAAVLSTRGRQQRRAVANRLRMALK